MHPLHPDQPCNGVSDAGAFAADAATVPWALRQQSMPGSRDCRPLSSVPGARIGTRDLPRRGYRAAVPPFRRCTVQGETFPGAWGVCAW
jgi:hypothetical protein